MIVNISSINDFVLDRRRWVYKWVQNRQPKAKAQPLLAGGMFHRAMESYLRDRSKTLSGWLTEQVNEARKEAKLLVPIGGSLEAVPDAQTLMDAAEEMEGMLEPLSYWEDKFPVKKTLEVETAFSFPLLDGVQLVGRPDRVVLVWDQLFHMQNRTLSSSKPIGLYLELAKRNLHEIAYAWAIQQKYPQYKYGGTIYNIIRKLKYRAKQTKSEAAAGIPGKILHTPEEMFVQSHVPITTHNFIQGIDDIKWLAEEMVRTKREFEHSGILPASNRMLDGGFYGNSRDPYLPVLLGQTTLDDDELYEDRTDNYSVAEVADEIR